MDSAGSGTALLSVDEREARQPSAISIQRDLHGDIEFVVPLDRSGSAARVVTVVPRNPVIDGFVDNDQLIEVVRVWHILKGAIHEQDGTGGTGDLQLNVEIRNLDEVNPGWFDIYMGEIEA